MKSRFPIVELGKHVRQVSQRNRAEADVEVFSVTNSEGFTRSTDYFNKEVFSKDVSNYKIVSPGQFAYNPSRINVGSIDYLRHDSPVLVSPLYIVFEGNKELHADYLLRYLKSGWGNAQIRANTEGAVRDSLKFKGLESINLPLPPLDGQIRIAHLLSKVEGLIAQRKQHLQQLDDLLKSVFLEMFGDTVRNEKGWNTQFLEEIVSDDCPLTYGIVQPGEDFPGGISVVRPVDLAVDKVSSKGLKRIDPRIDSQFARTRLKGGELLLCVRGTTGIVSIASPELEGANVTRGITPVWFDERVSMHFMLNQLKSQSVQRKIQEKTYGVALKQINLSDVRKLKLAIPPKQLQMIFSGTAEKVEEVKSCYQRSLTDLEALYGALSQQAFKGELDLSRVALPAAPNEGASPVAAAVLAPIIAPVIELPETDLLLPALQDRTQLTPLLRFWLEAYRTKLGGAVFSLERFTAAAQTRLAELHPDNDFEWAAGDYEIIKAWVFEALAAGALTQAFDDDGNRIELKATTEQSPA